MTIKAEPENAVSVEDVARSTRGQASGDLAVPVTDVTHDSREAAHGSLFTAVRGELFDAHKFVPQVMQQGAVGVISELERPADFNGAWIRVENIRQAMALAAA